MRMMKPVVAIAVWLALCCGVNAESRQIRIAFQLPSGSHLYESLDLFKRLVEKGTSGAFEISIAHSGKLVAEQDAPQAVATGAVEMASVAVNHYAGVVPAADLFVQPFLFAHPGVLAAATQPGSPVRAPIDQAILDRTGARVLWWHSNVATVAVSTEAALTTPAAIAGKSVRVSTASEAEFLKLCGGIPRIIPAAAQYQALADGLVTAGSSTIAAIPVRRFWEVAKYVTYTRHRTAEFIVTINEGVWRSLSAEHRQVFEKAAREAELASHSRVVAIEREAREMAEKQGMRFVDLATAEQQDQWKYCATPMLESYLSRAGSLGAKVLAGYRKVLHEVNVKAPAQARRLEGSN
jgi:C4-dicarboxylate-binding protein DctP